MFLAARTSLCALQGGYKRVSFHCSSLCISQSPLKQLRPVSTSRYILHYPYKRFCSRNFCLPPRYKRGRRFFWDANQLPINASQHARAKASCLWLSALHFLCWNIFKVSLLISTSLYTLRDNDTCPFLSAFHFLLFKISASPSPCQQFAAQSSQVSFLSAILSACCKILIGVLLTGIHSVLCNSGVPRGVHPPPRNSEGPPKSRQTQPDL